MIGFYDDIINLPLAFPQHFPYGTNKDNSKSSGAYTDFSEFGLSFLFLPNKKCCPNHRWLNHHCPRNNETALL